VSPAASLPTEAWDRLEQVLARFEGAWCAGQRPLIEDHLIGAGDERLVLLEELAHAEVELRAHAGESVRVEEYLRRFPELAADPRAALQLIRAEYELRWRAGSQVNAEEYRQRFPQYATSLEELLAVRPPTAACAAPIPTTVGETPASGQTGSERVPRAEVGPALVGYETLGELGHGGMGIVYKVRDTRRQAVVALKTLQRLDGAALYRFKREFRAVADLAHPNLVTLYELRGEGAAWFFTMEFVEGVDFLTHVCPRPAHGTPGPADPSSVSLARLRQGLHQLAEGVLALHGAGVLHRDIKPSNVLVTRSGRVVLLDFGLAAELTAEGQHQSAEGGVVGTVAYMAPEQAAGLPVSAASDWYSVGVMLFQALTGTLPFRGAPLKILRDKQLKDPQAPSTLAPNVPQDLDALCVELLRRDPQLRPAGAEVVRRIGSSLGPGREFAPAAPGPPQRGLFIGRERHLESLAQAFGSLARGRAAVIFLHGRSGIGKSALAAHFLDNIAASGDVVVLSGRCFERESVPYKALDSIVDALSRYLSHLPLTEAQELLPRDTLQLARLFPVLRRVEAIARPPARALDLPDPHELRRRAFAALRELLGRLGERRSLVLFIDDLQWGDVDSAALLGDLLRPPDPPTLLLLGCYRTEEVGRSPCLKLLLQPGSIDASAVDLAELAVERLTRLEVQTLVCKLLGVEDIAVTRLAEVIGRESDGNPFFVYELALYAQADQQRPGHPLSGQEITLDEVLWARIQRMPPNARRVLELVAVSGRPLAQALACQAAGLASGDWGPLAVLRSGRLIRGTGVADDEEVETFHDRIRETVAARLGPEEVRAHHRRLADALQSSSRTDPEILAVHFHGAGEPEQAGRLYARAAEEASTALAFDRAARLYRLAMELAPPGSQDQPELRRKLGNALANAGRGAEAARAFLAAAQEAGAPEALDFQRRAAEQFLRAGYVDEGVKTLQAILGMVGMRMAPTSRRALLSLLVLRLRLWFRGLRYRERDASQVPSEELLRIDLCWAATVGMTVADNVHGTAFQVRHLLLALRAGEPYRVALALGMEAGLSAIPGGRSQARALELQRKAIALAERIRNPHALAVATVMGGATRAWLVGRWRETREMADRAETILREQCTGVAWELTTSQVFSLAARAWLGEWSDHTRRIPSLLKEAKDRGDIYAASTIPLLTYSHVSHLLAGQRERARDEIATAIRQWSHRGFHLQHYWAMFGEVETALYLRDGGHARAIFASQWPGVYHSFLLRVQTIRLFTWHLRGRTALGAAGMRRSAREKGTMAQLLREAEHDARRIEREKMAWATPLASLLRAGVAALRGKREEVLQLLASAASGFDTAEMALFAAAARWRHGRYADGMQGRTSFQAAEEWMRGENVQNPARIVDMLIPGFPVQG
jgi:tRNA A-37 threonylcarbamoyl transferase component Bud32